VRWSININHLSPFWLFFWSEPVGSDWFQSEVGRTWFRVVRSELTFPIGIRLDKLDKFPTIWVVLCSRISDRILIGIWAVLTDSTRKTWGTNKTSSGRWRDCSWGRRTWRGVHTGCSLECVASHHRSWWPMTRRCQNLPPLLELIDGEEEYIMEKTLNSRMFQQKLQYLVKWEGYGTERNTWEYSENLNHTPEKVMEFHTENLGAPCRIHTLTFGSIPFHPISLSFTSSQCSSGGGVIVRGTPAAPLSASASAPAFHSSSASTPNSPPDIAPSASDLPSLLTHFLFVPHWHAMWLCTLHIFIDFDFILYIHDSVY